MARVIICEDDDGKLKSIAGFVESQGISRSDIITAGTLAEFATKLDNDIDVCIIDIRIPSYDGAQPDQNGPAILQMLEARNTSLLAISAYPEEFDALRTTFERRGCILANFHDPEMWQSALKTLLVQASARRSFDFLIFVALPKERAPYLAFNGMDARAVTEDGLNRLDIEINGKSGSIIELPSMGLVDAAITAAKCIDRFSPKMVAMSGICAGFPDRTELGALLVSSMAYEYQSGKWTDEGFSQGPYQIPITERMRICVRHMIDDEELLVELEQGWRETRPSKPTPPDLAIFTSGSAVIADARFLGQISEHHRKVSGLDMEIYAIHRAAHLSNSQPDVLCAKVVVDLADKEKNDDIQAYGCYVSAKFVSRAIQHFFDS